MKTRKMVTAASAVLAFSMVTQCSAQAKGSQTGTVAPAPKTDRIAMADFKRLFSANDVVILDVRSTEAYRAGHIPGALSMPEESLTPATAEKLRRMGKPIATYCS
jgi:predicted sulfurtransferase